MNDGGPAFPSTITRNVPIGQGQYFEAPPSPGMSLRDYFAAKSIPRVMKNIIHFDNELASGAADHASKIAKSCYILADAMLAEREKQSSAAEHSSSKEK